VEADGKGQNLIGWGWPIDEEQIKKVSFILTPPPPHSYQPQRMIKHQYV
jgi:hypothetical protein